jgi:hypothetical protein
MAEPGIGQHGLNRPFRSLEFLTLLLAKMFQEDRCDQYILSPLT